MEMKMKKILSILMIAAAFVVPSCSGEHQADLDDILILSPDSKNVISAGADIVVGIRANYKLAATSSASWVHVSVNELSTQAIVSVDENFDTEVRTAEVVFTTERGARAVFQLTQFSAQADEIAASIHEKTVPDEGGEFELTVSSAYRFRAECDEDWVELRVAGTTVTVAVSAYEDTDPRYATVRFVSDRGAEDELVITQTPGDFIALDRTQVTVDGKENIVDVAASAFYNVSAETEYSWISIAPKEGRNMFSVTVAANDDVSGRTGTVRFSTERGASVILTINQDAADIVQVDVKTKTVSPDSENFDVAVSSVYEYSVACDVDWVSIAKLDDNRYRLTVADNRTSRDVRVATVTFTSVRGAQATVVINQGGFFDEVSVSVSDIQATEYGARMTVTVTSNYPVAPSVDSDWLSVVGEGRTFTVCVARNESSESRSGHVTFTSDHGAKASVRVSQSPSPAPGSGTTLPFTDIEDINFD